MQHGNLHDRTTPSPHPTFHPPPPPPPHPTHPPAHSCPRVRPAGDSHHHAGHGCGYGPHPPGSWQPAHSLGGLPGPHLAAHREEGQVVWLPLVQGTAVHACCCKIPAPAANPGLLTVAQPQGPSSGPTASTLSSSPALCAAVVCQRVGAAAATDDLPQPPPAGPAAGTLLGAGEHLGRPRRRHARWRLVHHALLCSFLAVCCRAVLGKHTIWPHQDCIQQWVLRCWAWPAPSLAPPASARCLQGAVLAPAAIAAQESLLAPPLRRLGQLLGGGRRDPEIAVAPPLASLVRQLLLGSSFCSFVH